MKYLLSILAFGLVVFSSCDPTIPLTPTEQVQALLTGSGSTPTTWKVQSVKVNGVDKTSLFTGMTIAFGEGTFTVSNTGPVWPASGTFTFTNETGTTIKRNDNLEVIVVVTENHLVLTLMWDKTTYEPGRTKSVEGTHIFEFAP